MATVSLFWDTNMAAVTSCENTLYPLAFQYVTLHFRDQRGAPSLSLRSVTEIPLKSPFIFVNRSPIWYNDFRAGAKAFRYIVDIAIFSTKETIIFGNGFELTLALK